jgi:hypothetical protein
MNEEATEIEALPPEPNTPPEPSADDAALWDNSGFGHLQRVAKLFSASSMIPKEFRAARDDGGQGLANCAIALDIAQRTGQAPLAVLQSIYFVGGRPGWAAAYLIAQARLRGLEIDWTVETYGEPAKIERTITEWGEQRGQKIKRKVEATVPRIRVTAHTTIKGKPRSIAVDMDMAIAEGWTDNAKYSTLGELMLRYRSAAMLINLYMPEIKLGLPIAEEIEAVPVEADAVPAELIRARAALDRAAPVRQLPAHMDHEPELQRQPDPVPTQDDAPAFDDGDAP